MFVGGATIISLRVISIITYSIKISRTVGRPIKLLQPGIRQPCIQLVCSCTLFSSQALSFLTWIHSFYVQKINGDFGHTDIDDVLWMWFWVSSWDCPCIPALTLDWGIHGRICDPNHLFKTTSMKRHQCPTHDQNLLGSLPPLYLLHIKLISHKEGECLVWGLLHT